MLLNNVVEFLQSIYPSNNSSDGSHIMIRCPFCGDSSKNSSSTHFSILIDVDRKEPMVYQCFQPEFKCGAKGILTTDLLQKLGCSDMKTLMQLGAHNKTISKKIDSYKAKNKREYVSFNIDTKINKIKARYITSRLGIEFGIEDFKKYKIQLSLYDYLTINYINTLAFNKSYCDLINNYSIGFISMYDDYLICRDISKDSKLKKRYINYNISGKSEITDMKLYTIPSEVNILSPEPAILNIAEGAFSILGAYFHTNIDKGRYENTIYSANCGTGFYNTIKHLTTQYGLIEVVINIFSDSEVPVKEYEKLFKRLNKELIIREFKIVYNTLKEDFGYSSDNIQSNIINLL